MCLNYYTLGHNVCVKEIKKAEIWTQHLLKLDLIIASCYFCVVDGCCEVPGICIADCVVPCAVDFVSVSCTANGVTINPELRSTALPSLSCIRTVAKLWE